MKLDDLRALEGDVRDHRRRAEELGRAVVRVKHHRRAHAEGSEPDSDRVYVSRALLGQYAPKDAENEVLEALDDFLPDLYRLAEMRLLVKQRQEKLSADLKEQRLKVLLARLPEVES